MSTSIHDEKQSKSVGELPKNGHLAAIYVISVEGSLLRLLQPSQNEAQYLYGLKASLLRQMYFESSRKVAVNQS